MYPVIDCYYWFIDREPTHQSIAKMSDVSCTVQVGVQLEPTNGTSERMFSSYTDIPALRTHFTRVLWRNTENGLSLSLCLILDERFELGISPSTELPVESLTLFLVLLDREVFKYNDIGILDDTFRYTMVHISLEPSFSPAQPFKLSLSRRSAYRLQSLTIIGISTSYLSEMTGIKEFTVGSNSDIIDTTVNPDNFRVVNFIDMGHRNLYYQIQDYPVFPDSYTEADYSSGFIFFETIGDADRYFLSTINCGQRYNPTIEESAECTTVEPGRAIGFFHRERPKLFSLEHFTGTIPRSLNKRGLETGPFPTGLVISEGLKLSFRIGTVIESQLKKEVGTFIEHQNGICDDLVRSNMENNRTSQRSPIPNITIYPIIYITNEYPLLHRMNSVVSG